MKKARIAAGPVVSAWLKGLGLKDGYQSTLICNPHVGNELRAASGESSSGLPAPLASTGVSVTMGRQCSVLRPGERLPSALFSPTGSLTKLALSVPSRSPGLTRSRVGAIRRSPAGEPGTGVTAGSPMGKADNAAGAVAIESPAATGTGKPMHKVIQQPASTWRVRLHDLFELSGMDDT
jgi:hypothetical protein